MWQDEDDEIESALRRGGPRAELHRELREKLCERSCRGEASVKLEVQGSRLVRLGVDQCAADIGKDRKKDSPGRMKSQKQMKKKINKFGELVSTLRDISITDVKCLTTTTTISKKRCSVVAF